MIIATAWIAFFRVKNSGKDKSAGSFNFTNCLLLSPCFSSWTQIRNSNVQSHNLMFKIKIQMKYLKCKQGSQYRTVPVGMPNIYRTGMVNLRISYRKKYWPYRSISGNTGRYRKKVFFYYYYFLSFVIFEFLLG